MLRLSVQLSFLALTLIGVFVFGANCEKWCPFGGVESLYTYATEGALTCSLGVSNFYILGGVLLATLLVGRAFCGYACPLGTIGRFCDMLGNRFKAIRVRKQRTRIPAKWETSLGSLKYIIAIAILYLTWKTGELVFRAVDPCYALLSRHGEDITFWAYVVSGTLLVLSVFISLPFCRWFCPFAAVLNPISKLARFRIRRDEESCTNCGNCRKACPMAIPIDTGKGEYVARCISCTDCVSSCPANKKQSETKKTLRGTLPQSMVIAVLIACIGFSVSLYAMYPLPSFTKVRGERPAQTETLTFEIENLTCRGTANKLLFFIDRDDIYQLPGYVLLEVWPDPNVGRIRITFDPSEVSRENICQAITEPYVNFADSESTGQIMTSPFVIKGYDPLNLPSDIEPPSILLQP